MALSERISGDDLQFARDELAVFSAKTADDLLTALAEIHPLNREPVLHLCKLPILRAAADLCGIDSVDMTKRQAIQSIVTNF